MARGLFVHTSTRLEDLFGELAAIVAGDPLPPLQNEVIAVPSQGIARWLRVQLAARTGIAAGLELPFLGTFFARLLAASVTLMFFTYAFVNMGMVSGILPVVGVPLPFISYGGTALLTLFIGIGILMSVHNHRRLVQT